MKHAHSPIIQAELARNVHPRVFYGKQELDALKARLATDAIAQAEIARLSKKSDELLEVPFLSEEYANAAMTQHGNFYEIGSQLSNFANHFSLMYSLGETKYTPKMIDALLHYASFSAWTGPANQFRKTPWQSDLSTTRILLAYAQAYDAMYDVITEADRKTIRTAMLNLGIRPLLADWLQDGARIHALDSMGHNWWAVCTALAGVGLCAIYEDVPDWTDMMEHILLSLAEFCDYPGEPLLNKVANFDSQGMFYESCGYFNYGAGELCRFLCAYHRCFKDHGESDFPILRQVGDAYLSLTYPTRGDERTLYVNFGDSALRSPADVRDGMTLLPQYLLILGLGNENLRRYYARSARKATIVDLLFPALLPSLDADAPVPDLPAIAFYPETGLAMLRHGDCVDGTLLSIRCGFTWNHAHDDAGTFILMRNGEDILCDSGNVPYSKKDYITHYCAAEAHNVVTVNGHGQHKETIYRGNKFPGRLLHLVHDEEIRYVLADATGPMCDSCLRNHRNFLQLGDDILVTIDDLYTYENAQFAYLLHHRGKATHENEHTVRITTDKNDLRITAISPVPITIKSDSYEDLSYLSTETTAASRLCNMMHIISPTSANVTLLPLSCADGYGVRLMTASRIYDVYYNNLADGRCMHINSNTTLGEFDTDAYILCICRVKDETADKVFMAYGSYLRTDGRSAYENLRKTFQIIRL